MAQEKGNAFRGSIKYPLHRLDHEDASGNTRQLDQKNVERLISVFELEGCLRLNAENHVPALISRSSLSALLESLTGGESRLRAADEEPIMVDIPNRLTYLHGRHRLEAAKRALPAREKWWVVDLYAEEALSEKGVQSIRDEYLNARDFYDGEIFRRLRQCHLSGDQVGKKKWLSRLSNAKQRDVKTLEKRHDGESKAFAESLDKLIPFAGLWLALQLGTFHRLLSIRCLEEMTYYLQYIWQTWDYIAQGENAMRTQLDVAMVEILQGRCPRYSEDRTYIEARRSRVFPLIFNPETRQNLWERIMSIDSIIPSLHTFLEDTKYLEPCAKVLKGLLPKTFRGSIRQAFERLHNGQRLLKLQIAEDHSRLQEQSSAAVNHWKAYRQLWLYAMRHFPHMVGHAPRKDLKVKKSLTPSPEYIWWHSIAELAIACGYGEVNHPFPSIQDADIKMTEEFLHRVRPSINGYTATEFNRKVKEVVAILQDIGTPIHSSQPAVSKDLVFDDLAHRCGVPFAETFDLDSQFLFLDPIYSVTPAEEPLTSFLIKRDMFRRFFGTLDGEPFGGRLNGSPSLGGNLSVGGKSAPSDFTRDDLAETDSTRDGLGGGLVATVPTIEYSASEYSQPSGSLTPRPSTPIELPKERSRGPHSQLPLSQTGVEQLRMLPSQSLSQVEALKIFWTFQDNSPDPEKMVIIKEESNGRFTLHVLAHNDQRGIISTVGNRKALVREGPRSDRQRVTGLVDLKTRREPCVMVYHPLHERQIH